MIGLALGYFTGFGDSAIHMSLRFWLDLRRDGTDFLIARSRGIVAVKRAFGAAGISIPFPIRTLDFGIVGGQTLAEMLEGGAQTQAAAD